ncbi:hypothetical protein JCM6882_002561 [Rhodosporidiobolus microsporus]
MHQLDATAGLFYGIHVRIGDLCIVVSAWQRCRGAYHGLQLIRARREAGTFEARHSDSDSAVKRLPAEVWTLIQRQVVDDALAEAAQRFDRLASLFDDFGIAYGPCNHAPSESSRSWEEEKDLSPLTVLVARASLPTLHSSHVHLKRCELTEYGSLQRVSLTQLDGVEKQSAPVLRRFTRLFRLQTFSAAASCADDDEPKKGAEEGTDLSFEPAGWHLLHRLDVYPW